MLLITSPEEDYLQDSIIHGFKELFGKDAVDFPAKNILYKDYADFKNVHGNGFTLYGLLDCNLKPEVELNIKNESFNEFNLIIFTSIHRQYNFFYKYFEALKKASADVWIIDGEDSPILFPYMGKQLKRFLFSSKPHKNFIYFKREMLPETLDSIYFRMPVNLLKLFSFPKNIKPVSFSIPRQKITDRLPEKKKLFVQDIVDEEVALNVYGKSTRNRLNSEQEYYKDIQDSKFGITTKRAGWDCLRHYEIAANGAVICFKNLDKKPKICAPHGLVPNYNCISYSGYNDLMETIKNISDEAYSDLLQRSFDWVKAQTTVERVSNLLSKYISNFKSG